MPESVDERVSQMHEVIVGLPPAVRGEAMRLATELMALHRDHQKEVARLRAEKQQILVDTQQYAGEIEALKKKFAELENPPLLHATLIGPSGRGEKTYEIGIGGHRYDVNLALPEGSPLKAEDLTQGCEVLVTRDTNAIVGLVGTGRRGEAAEVREVLRDPAAKGGERLLVRSSGSASVVIDLSDRLSQLPVESDDPTALTKPKVGDTVLVDTAAKMAFEKLNIHETSELELSENPGIRYTDIAGLEEQIERIRDAIELPYMERARFELYRLKRPRGILLYGPPGCGKTMIGAAVANGLRTRIEEQLDSCIAGIQRHMTLPREEAAAELPELKLRMPPDIALNLERPEEALEQLRSRRGEVKSYFLNIKGPELLSKWVGEAEQRVRQIFEEAKARASYTRPVVVFFDEIEAMFQRRGSGLSSDMEKTMVPQLLTMLDGVEALRDVILIGASNRHELLDPALLRPGRLDIKIKIDRPDQEATRAIFRVHLGSHSGLGLPLSSEGLDAASCGSFDREVTEVVGRVIESASISVRYQDGQERTMALGVAVPGPLVPDLVVRIRDKVVHGCQVDSKGQKLHFTEIAEAIEAFVVAREVAEEARVLLNLGTAEKLIQGIRLPRVPLAAMLPLAQPTDQESLLTMMIEIVVAAMFSPQSYLRARVVAPCAQEHVFRLREFVSGALVANVVLRAKRSAVKRDAAPRDSEFPAPPIGMNVGDLLAGIREEYEENKDQFIANQPEVGEALCPACKRRHNNAAEYNIDVLLGHGARDRWRGRRVPPYESARRTAKAMKVGGTQ